MIKKLKCISAFIIAAVLVLNIYIPVFASEPSPRTVRIPYGFNNFLTVDESENVSGFYAEYFEELAKTNNWKYEYVLTDWTSAVEMLQNGEIDILYPTNYSEERDEFMDFSAMPTGYIATGIFALGKSGYRYNDYSSYDGARIAYVKDSSNNEQLRLFAEKYGFSYESVYFQDNYEIINALKNGEADLAVFNSANNFEDSILVSMMSSQPVYITVKKGNTELLSEIDSGMQQLIIDSPDLVSDTILKTLVGDNTGILAFTPEERDFADSCEEITVGFYEENEPFAYVNEDGSYDGIYIEIITYLREKSGLNLVPCPISSETDWKSLIKDGKIDFFIGVSDLDASRDEGLRTTNSFMEFNNVLTTRNDRDINTIEKPVIAVTRRSEIWADYIRKNFNKEIDIRFYDTTKECMLAVLEKKADAALINNMELNYHTKNDRISGLVQSPKYRFPTSIHLAASANSDNIMFSAVNKSLKLITADNIQEVTDKCLEMPYHSYDFNDYVFNSRYFILVAVPVFLGLIVIFVLYGVFRRRQASLNEKAKENERNQLRIVAALSLDYAVIYSADLDSGISTLVRVAEGYERSVPEIKDYSAILRDYANTSVLPEYKDIILELSDLKNIISRFESEKNFFIRYQVRQSDKGKEYYEMNFADISDEKAGQKMVFGIRCVDEIVREEQNQRQVLKDALDSANLASSAKSEFLSRMSHDIRTPMNAIIGMTAIAKAHTDDPDRVLDCLNKISSSGNYLLSLVNDILDMSKIEAGKFALTEENFDITDLIDSIISMIKPQIKEHNHSLNVEIGNITHKDVIGDSLRLKQVFMNILGNSIKYTPDGGIISVSVSEKKIRNASAGCYEFVFSDNGIGMSEEFVEHIFEPFRRAEDLRISKIQGTGLGLSITRNIVQMMNGTIEIKSKEGKGTVFTLTVIFKLQSVNAVPAAKEVSQTGKDIKKGDYSGRKILIAEDNELNREIAKEILEMSGITVEEAENGKIAVEMFAESPVGYYDMILMDVQMPVLNGYEATSAIRKLDRQDAEGIPIAAVTANAFVEDIKASKAAGMNEHLSKPINFDELSMLLDKYLG